jgi:hypothetical protein
VTFTLEIGGILMKQILLLLIVCGILITTAHAMTWEDYQTRKSEPNIKFYISGVGAGYFYTNNYLNTIGRPKLYCPPEAMSTNMPGEMYPVILEGYADIVGNKKLKGVSVEIILLQSLVELYPCK